MKATAFNKLLSCFLAAVMLFTTFAVSVHAQGENVGKYVKDVFVATGEDKAQAEAWLRDHGWEPLCDLNDGKSSTAPGKHNSVAVLGIKRTNDPKEAVTDMATMFMTGGYSFDDYEGLVKQKKADIEEFINTFVPALNEYRDNYNGKGSAGGKKRAQTAHDILNKFFDGDPKGQYAVNDTGKPLGDLLLNKTKTEIGDAAYNALSAEQKLNTADLQQIILESSGPAVLILEQTLALATDTARTSWMQRVDGLTGEDLVERIDQFAPEAKGQELAPSTAMTLLAAHFEDYARILAEQWSGVRDEIIWYEEYCEENDLWQGDDDDEAFTARVEAYFTALKEESPESFEEEFKKFYDIDVYYYALRDVDYSGEWGETLFDFFRPEDEDADYSEEFEYFAPIAASLSDGQRAALEFISLPALIRFGLDSDSAMEAEFPSVGDLFKSEDGKELESISIYSGINRAIFRKGVALTSQTLMQKAMGRDPYESVWDEFGIADIVAYSSFALGTVSMITGAGLMVAAKSIQAAQVVQATQAAKIVEDISAFNEVIDSLDALEQGKTVVTQSETVIASRGADVNKAMNSTSAFGTAAKWMMGIGGALMVLAAVLKGVQLYKYYHRDFSPIPTMIVDEADIVSYTTNSKGNKVRVLTFDQFTYYEAVKCNRQEIGLNPSAQNGVSDYESWGCPDAADINGDVGMQWLALYVNRSPKKGDPILADSLLLRTGKEEIEKAKAAGKSTDKVELEAAKMPEGYTGCLHMFMEENPVKIDHEDYCYRSDNEGMYLYWKGDATAFADAAASTASAFNNGGYIALSGVGGLALGILGTALVTGRKKKETEAA